ncbi:predicted protein [Arabidopsis lyrata subsp. lyrata]|uniref:Predicted protein n=1 Tax=Arabidopsis lyrata subsp. lyrata TaxID=81972 RepID=D7KP02_ARALL|nr:predicted protein [Arabidopsis lyrata subsp. lyrata]
MSRCFSVDWGFRNGLFRVIFGLEKGFVVIVFLRDLDWLCSRQVKISFHLVFRGLESRINQLRISQIYRFGELKWICFKDSSYLLITDGNSEIFRWSFGKLIFKISIDGFSSAKSGYGETLVGARLDQLEESMSDLVLIQMRRRLGGCYLGISMRIAVIKVLNIGNFKSSKIIEIVWLVVGSKNVSQFGSYGSTSVEQRQGCDGDEVVVSLDYEKLVNFCQHCSRLTHDMVVCPELQKKAGNRLYEEYGDRRGGQRQHNNAKLVSQGQDGGWEKPRKPAAKRALEFSGEEMNGGFRYHSEMGDSNKQSHQKIEKNQGPIWGQKKSFPGTWAESSETLEKVVARDSFKEAHSQSQGTSYGRKGAGPAWPKPLYQPKTVSKETQETKNSEQGDDLGDLAMEDVPEMEDKDINAGIQISESADDLLEDGECQVDEETDNQETMEEITDADGQIIPEGEKIGPQGNEWYGIG